MNSVVRRLRFLAVAVVIMASWSASALAAPLSPQQIKILQRNPTSKFNNEIEAVCSTSTTTAAATTGGSGNVDYTGAAILNPTQLADIDLNKATYMAAASQEGIPWAMIAVVHLRETGLKRVNPGNGQGIYQFYGSPAGKYPSGPVDDAKFLEQTIEAAKFLKNTANGNNPANKDLSTGSADAVKDTFFGYNGRAGVYKRQAVSLGFTEDQGYEGSPYVMNRADAKRDPNVSGATWGQIKTDGGGIVYPANKDYGAFVVYSAIAGTPVGGSTCATGSSANSVLSGPVRTKVVQLAQQELQRWNSGELKPGTDFFKYSHGVNANWCAFFSSWVYNEAGYPIDPGAANGSVGPVTNIMSIGQQNTRFKYNAATSNYTPKPGDLAIYKNGMSHVNIVTSVENGKVTVIGGNQGNGGFNTTKVTEYSFTGIGSGLTGYVSPAED